MRVQQCSSSKSCLLNKLTFSKPLSGFWTSPLMKPTFAVCQSVLLSGKAIKYKHILKSILQTSIEKWLIWCLQRQVPAWKSWARSSWGGKQSCGSERRWFRAQRCSCADSGRCRPRQPIFLWLLLEWPCRRNEGSLWQSSCLSWRGKRKTSWFNMGCCL